MATREEKLRRLRFLELKQKSSGLGQGIETDVSLPEKERTERLITGRRDPVEVFKEEAGYEPKNLRERLLQPPTLGLKALAIPYRRGEAAIANPLMKLQEEYGQPLPPAPDLRDVSRPVATKLGGERTLAGLERVAGVGKEAWKGLTGQRLGEVGDIPRRAGFGEVPSAIIGLGTMFGLGDLITGGKVAPKGKLPQRMGKDYTLDKATKAVDLIDEARGQLGKNVGNVVDDVANVVVDPTTIKLKPLPQNVQTALTDPIYGIKRLPDGSFEPTIGNLQKILTALDDFMTTKSWEEAGKMSRRLIKQNYGVIRQAMKAKAPQLEEPLRMYSGFMKIYRRVNKTLRDTSGEILEKKTRGIFKPDAERTYRKAWDEMVKFTPELKQVIKDMMRFTSRQGTKKFLGAMGKSIARISILGGVAGKAIGGSRGMRD